MTRTATFTRRMALASAQAALLLLAFSSAPMAQDEADRDDLVHRHETLTSEVESLRTRMEMLKAEGYKMSRDGRTGERKAIKAEWDIAAKELAEKEEELENLSPLLTPVASLPWAEGEEPDGYRDVIVRIKMLDEERAEISTTGPRVATFIGLGTMMLGGAMLGASASQCPNRDQGDCESFGAVMAGAALTGIGIVTSLGGGVVWGVRAHRRNEIDAERESLIEERDGFTAALSRLELRSPYRDGTQFVTLRVRF